VIDTVAGELAAECECAMAKFASFNSAHEGYAVILEELDEAWTEIKRNNVELAIEEMVQVGAMALRFVVEMRAQQSRRAAAELPVGPW
jgi:hypothetical protein